MKKDPHEIELNKAAKAGDLNEIQRLVKISPISEESSVLKTAASAGNLEVVKFLVNVMDSNYSNVWGPTFCNKNAQSEVFNFLLPFINLKINGTDLLVEAALFQLRNLF